MQQFEHASEIKDNVTLEHGEIKYLAQVEVEKRVLVVGKAFEKETIDVIILEFNVARESE